MPAHGYDAEPAMRFHPPAGLAPFEVFFDSSEKNLALPEDVLRFTGNVGFPEEPPDRPWVFANFVQSIDGIVSFGGTRPGGEWIARSRHDRWMMDLLRTHADALICGARSLELEARYGSIRGGPVYRIANSELLRLRESVLGRAKLKNIIVTGSGRLRPEEFRLFQSEQVEAWIATTPAGLRELGDTGKLRILATGAGNQVNWHELLRSLRKEHGVRYLLCEGGPVLYGSMARAGLIDEKFLTISPQEIGSGFPEKEGAEDREANAGERGRPTSFGGPGLSAETARWYEWISCRRADHHEFNRYRISSGSRQPPSGTIRA
jgi:5-amino-6-(5-phosphoribosylamino)uracil reductase